MRKGCLHRHPQRLGRHRLPCICQPAEGGRLNGAHGSAVKPCAVHSNTGRWWPKPSPSAAVRFPY